MFDIHGSCVSRDVFNFASNLDVKHDSYIARNSFFSFLSEPFANEYNSGLTSAFQQRLLDNDLKKTTMFYFRESNSKYLIIDFIDTVRFDLVKYKECLYTRSTEFVRSCLENQFNFKRINHLNYNNHHVEIMLKKYIRTIIELFDADKIILHCVYYKDDYISKDGTVISFDDTIQKRNKLLNCTLEMYYNLFKKYLDCHVIDINKKSEFIAKEEHMWGLSPIHYCDEYYIKVIKQLQSIKEL